MVDDNGVASSALAHGPAEAGAELVAVVRSEDLSESQLARHDAELRQSAETETPTTNSSEILLALPQPDMT